MVLDVGETVMLLPVPANVPPHEPVNHSAIAPVPADPPNTVRVVLLPLQIVVVPVMLVGATDGSSRVMTTSFGESVQMPFDKVHRKVLTPILNPLTVAVGLLIFEKVPLPEITLHVPTPDAGVLAASVAEVAQTVWSGPASAVVKSSLEIVTSSCESVQSPLDNVHRKIFAPIERPVTAPFGLLMPDVKVPLPETMLQVPTPVAGILAASVAELPNEEHIV